MRSRREVEDSFEAVPAYIVADKRDRFGKRLGQLAFVLLLLYFVINSYVQSARNGEQLDEAREQRASLIKNQELTFQGLQQQGALIAQLQGTISRQNEILQKAGLPVEKVPNLQDLIDQFSTPTPSPSSGSSPRPAPRSGTSNPPSSPQPDPSPRPTSKPTSRPQPTPSPTRGPITQTVCQLTRICL